MTKYTFVFSARSIFVIRCEIDTTPTITNFKTRRKLNVTFDLCKKMHNV